MRKPVLLKQEQELRFNRLSEMGCCICGAPPQIHHLIGGGRRGISQKARDDETIPLCLNHHTGAEGIHVIGLVTWEEFYGTQESLLERVNEVLEMMS